MDILVESSVRSTLIVAAVALVLKAMRVASPSIRHAAWTGVTLMMLSLPALVAWGPDASVRLLPADVSDAWTIAPSPAGAAAAARTGTARTVTPPAPVEGDAGWNWRTYAAGAYFLGLAVLMLRLAAGTLQVHWLTRRAVLKKDMLTHASCPAPVTVGWIRPKVILPAEWSQWPQEQLDAILAHEGEHVRRRDPLVQWLALLNRAVFWFHPLAWWLERRVSALAEEASDAAVLARGHDPHDYSGYLLDIARSVTRAGGRVHVIGMSMPGTNLPHRIRQILEGVSAPQTSRLRVAGVAALCLVSTAAIAVGTPAQIEVVTPAFDVTSIRPNRSGDGSDIVELQPGGRVTAANVTAARLVRTVYGLFEDEQLIGGPSWLDEDRFAIEARTSATASIEQVRLMLRRLLADRFNLVGHIETRQLPLYELIMARSDGRLGPGLRRAGAECAPMKSLFRDVPGAPPPPPPPPPPPSRSAIPVSPPQRDEWRCPNLNAPGWLSGRQLTMPQVAQILTHWLQRQVVDRTSLEGVFDVDFTYAPESVAPGGGPPPAGSSGVVGGPIDGDAPGDGNVAVASSGGRSIFTALREDLGLTLRSTRGPVKVFVIDRLERPSEN